MTIEGTQAVNQVLESEALRWLAGDRAFGRGETYAQSGAVESLRRRGNGVEAVVQGSERYRTRLTIVDGLLEHACTCPVGDDGSFCKHCVAVALVWRDGTEVVSDGLDTNDADLPGAEEIRAHLAGLDKDSLIALIIDHAQEDPALRRRLMLRAAGGMATPVAVMAWKQAFADAIALGDQAAHGYLYRGGGYEIGIELDYDDLLDTLGNLMRAGEADTVIQLVEHGSAEIEETLGMIDDSEGELTELLELLQPIHLEACALARPDPAELAERLFELEMESEFILTGGAVAAYDDILGDAGRASYRRLAEAEWARIPVLGPGDHDPECYGRRWRIASIMKTLAQMDDDLETLVAVMSRDLSKPFQFLDIARLCHEAGDNERALDWAERGWRSFSGFQRDERLRDYLGDLYQELGRHEEAIALVWEGFAASPWLGHYQKLEARATFGGQWSSWRERAIARARELSAPSRSTGRGVTEPRLPLVPRDHTLLVEIFLYENDVDAAWREAETGGCSDDLWLVLAGRREKSHPDQAIDIYTRHVEGLVARTGDRAYHEAMDHLTRIAKLRSRSGADAEFKRQVLGIRVAQRRKRKLLAMFDARGW